MNFNPMDLILIKEHFGAGCLNVEEVSKFINLLIELQRTKKEDFDVPLKEKLGAYFFAKQKFIDDGCKFAKAIMEDT